MSLQEQQNMARVHGEKYGRNRAIDLDNLLIHSLSDYSENKYLEKTLGVKENISVKGSSFVS